MYVCVFYISNMHIHLKSSESGILRSISSLYISDYPGLPKPSKSAYEAALD